MKAKRGARRKTAKKSGTRDLGALDRGAGRVKGGARRSGIRKGKRI